MEVLVTGDISFVTEEFLEAAFPKQHVVIAGEGSLYLKKSKEVSIYPISVLDSRFVDLFNSHNFEQIIYFSEYLEYHGQPSGAMEKLKALFRACQHIHVGQESKVPQIIYVTPLDVTSDVQTSNVVVLRACEELCKYYKTKYMLPIKIVRSPYLIQDDNMESYFNGLFRQMNKEGKVVFKETREQEGEFLAMKDLGEFLYRFMDNWDNDIHIVNLPGGFIMTFEEIGEKLKSIKPGIEVEYTGHMAYYHRENNSKVARREFGWFARINLLEALPGLYENYLSHENEEPTMWEQVKDFYHRHSFILWGLELIAGFILVELINLLMGTSVQFSLIDIRLIFIVIIASVHGVNMGLAAAILEGISIVLSYKTQGMDWHVLFYEPVNWVVFIWYLVVGAVCGYVHDKKSSELEYANKDYELLEEKYRYINQVYTDTSMHKLQYRKQIIGFKNSFGKIFDITKRLDDVVPDKIFEEALASMEELLENKSIAVFSVCNGQNFARLNVVSHTLNHTVPKTLMLKEYELAIPTLQRGEVWRNVDLLPEYPAYMAGVKKGDELVAIINVYQVEYDQMGMYYANLIRVMAGLFQISLYRAIEYERAVHAEQYEEDTNIMKKEPFKNLWNIKVNMMKSGIAEATLLKLSGPGKVTMENFAQLEKQIRDTDAIGRGADGELYLLLSQVDDRSLDIVLHRLEHTAFTFEKVSEPGGE